LLAHLVVKDPAEAIGAGAQALGEVSNRHFSGSRAFQVCVTDPDAGAIYGVMCVAPAISFQETSAPVNFLLGAKASVYEAVFMMNDSS
jgi:hypothetical protein